MRETVANVLDQEAVLALFDGQWPLIEEVAALVLGECPPRLLAVEAAISAGDARSLERHAHRLRGAVAQFQPHALLQTLQRMEARGREGNLHGIEEELRTLRSELEQFFLALRAWLQSA